MSQSVYKYLSADGTVLYVGVTGRGIERQEQHAGESVWWRFVDRCEIEHFADRRSALARERFLIARLKPLFNVRVSARWSEPFRLALQAKKARIETAE